MAEVEGRSFVSDLGPLPALNPAPSPRREVVEGPALDAGGVKARSLVIVYEGAYRAVAAVLLEVADGTSDPVALAKLPEFPLDACVVSAAPVANPSLLAAEMLVSEA